ncbi:hypothetical protein IPZ58_27630 [Streptomyces roseoverticillatus]|uniref:hypothetical protein n=1 Tax=Streptomyces roseoverticillatus TaxID=66429 RepID=UPI001F25C745|nr:hypothetical protein [Streptomyces roseoverticillatus]MCF3105336.1 hypothetical protein [Streptomyces roseoverticillatus]
MTSMLEQLIKEHPAWAGCVGVYITATLPPAISWYAKGMRPRLHRAAQRQRNLRNRLQTLWRALHRMMDEEQPHSHSSPPE